MSILAARQALEYRHEQAIDQLEEKAFKAFCKLRWPPKGKPRCPRCGYADKSYLLTDRRRFNCAASICKYQYSPTMGTIFSSRKMSYTDIMIALEILPEGIPAWQLKDRLGLQYKTAYVLDKKFRAAGGLLINDAAKAWGGYWQQPRPGRVTRPYRRYQKTDT